MAEPAVTQAVVRRSREHWILVGASALGPLGLLLMRVLLTPSPQGYGTHEQLGMPACQAINWFGIPCPGCGVTTSVTWFAHGHPLQSFVVQPFGFTLAALAALALPYALVRTALGLDLRDDLRLLSDRRLWIGGAVVLVLAWIYKIVVVVQTH